ncbi:MAG TPA: hypothetical protein VGI92_09470 [Gemmatimonadales bacterium]
MRIFRCLRAGLGFVLVASVAVVASCSESFSPVTAPPETAPSDNLFGGGHGNGHGGGHGKDLLDLNLLSCTPMPYDSVTQVIGPSGGTIHVSAYSFTVPAGALSSAVAITAVAPSGSANVIKFQPEGLHFEQDAWLTMSYANCSILGSLLPRSIAHTDDLLNILYLIPSIDNIFTRSVTGRVQHFSDYAVAW